jgi:hypothetical protein
MEKIDRINLETVYGSILENNDVSIVGHGGIISAPDGSGLNQVEDGIEIPFSDLQEAWKSLHRLKLMVYGGSINVEDLKKEVDLAYNAVYPNFRREKSKREAMGLRNRLSKKLD